MQTSYSLHQIDNPVDFTFSPIAYSRFKFGDDFVAESFGSTLAKGFIEQHLSTLTTTSQIVVISSPFAFIPTATFAMKNYFVFELNKWLAENGCPVVQEAKIHRTITYKEDYGELDAIERLKLIGNDSFHIDKSFLTNKTLIFLDDIKITGSHERMITKMITAFGLTNDVYLLYFAELINKTIHPNIENYLNYYFVKSIDDLCTIIKNGRFAINTRIVKYILNTPLVEFDSFIQNRNGDFRNLLYNMALGNSYHTIEAYSHNMELLKNYCKASESSLSIKNQSR
jgi:PRTase ComF-like